MLPWTHSGGLFDRGPEANLRIDGKPEIELAFLIDKRRWGEGFATEAATGIIEYARDRLGLKRLICLIMSGNVASTRVAQRVGMAFDRTYHDEFGACESWARSLG